VSLLGGAERHRQLGAGLEASIARLGQRDLEERLDPRRDRRERRRPQPALMWTTA